MPITPSRDWSAPHGHLPDPKEPEAAERKPSLLGLSMRMCQPEFAMDNVWHVLDVLEGSPAESAGLVPYGDWIIGWSGGVLAAEGDFYDVVEAVRYFPLFSSLPSFPSTDGPCPFNFRCMHVLWSVRSHVFTTLRSISRNRCGSMSILTTLSE